MKHTIPAFGREGGNQPKHSLKQFREPAFPFPLWSVCGNCTQHSLELNFFANFNFCSLVALPTSNTRLLFKASSHKGTTRCVWSIPVSNPQGTAGQDQPDAFALQLWGPPLAYTSDPTSQCISMPLTFAPVLCPGKKCVLLHRVKLPILANIQKTKWKPPDAGDGAGLRGRRSEFRAERKP